VVRADQGQRALERKQKTMRIIKYLLIALALFACGSYDDAVLDTDQDELGTVEQPYIVSRTNYGYKYLNNNAVPCTYAAGDICFLPISKAITAAWDMTGMTAAKQTAASLRGANAFVHMQNAVANTGFTIAANPNPLAATVRFRDTLNVGLGTNIDRYVQVVCTNSVTNFETNVPGTYRHCNRADAFVSMDKLATDFGGIGSTSFNRELEHIYEHVLSLAVGNGGRTDTISNGKASSRLLGAVATGITANEKCKMNNFFDTNVSVLTFTVDCGL
jgi:hypothetical protein